MARTDPFKETFQRTNQKVIEYGISKTFYNNKKLTKAELSEIKKELQEGRKENFRIIYTTNPAEIWELYQHDPIVKYIVVEDIKDAGYHCTWNEDLLNSLPDDWLRGIVKLCETHKEKTL